MAEKATVIVTPQASVFGCVNILKPDTKYNAAGDYKIKVKIPKGTKGLQAQLEAIEDARDKAKAEFLKNPKNKGKRVKEGDLPFYDDGDGNIVMSFKSVASWVDSKTGETRNRKIPVFGGAGRIDPEKVPQFGEGSTVRVAYTLSGYCNAAVGAGVSLRIDSLKLLEVKQFSGGGAQDHFGDDEGGYVPSTEDDGPANPYGDDEEGSVERAPDESDEF